MRASMQKYPFELEFTRRDFRPQIGDKVQIGHYFVFVDDAAKVLYKSGKRARLLGHRPQRRVLPIVDQPIALKGVTLKPKKRDVERLGCVVADRDLYRAEEDVVNLFVALPDPPEDLKLIVEQNGEPFTEREPELEDGGVAVETLAALLPGTYSAQLAAGGRRAGMPATFTVAEYTLAPLSARLVSHELQAKGKKLAFELAVESYQVPFDGELRVALVEDGREKKHVTLRAESPGCYLGRLPVSGKGALRLRLTATDDARRSAEVALPGSRAAERKDTVVSELGREISFSLMPRAGATALRGGYLSAGDELETPLVVDEVVTERTVLRAELAVQDLHLVVLDLASGRWQVEEHGDVEAGDEVEVTAGGPVSMVFAGGFVAGSAFEGFTTFLRPNRLELSIDAPETIRPRENLVVRLEHSAGDTRVQVLLSVRDERLTATDRPAAGLAASAKRGLDGATAGMADQGFVPLSDLVHDSFQGMPRGSFRLRGSGFGLENLAGDDDLLAPDWLLGGRSRDAPVRAISVGLAPGAAAEVLEGVAYRVPEDPASGGAAAPAQAAEPPAPRSEMPEALFFGLVPVAGSEELVIPLGDSLGTFTVEAFALTDGDWTETRHSLVIDQPVRIDLEVPPAVHPDDTVRGRLRAATASGRARIRLTCDGDDVELLGSRGGEVAAGELASPVELEFVLRPGVYLARVEDAESDDSDTLEIRVGEPGKLKSYGREIGLLQEGESLDLERAGALTLRLLPNVDQPFENLVTATAGYSHLCCEQTAAKILSATFMYLSAASPVARSLAEEIILAGLAREHKMHLPGRGFSLYPGGKRVSEHYSPLAVRYLWTLDQLDEMPDLSGSLRSALEDSREMVADAAAAHGLARRPDRIASIEDAYAVVTAGGDAEGALGFVRSSLDVQGHEVRVHPPSQRRWHQVAERTFLAYAAATLIALGDRRLGTRVANLITRQLNAEGRLYSTVDSVAAIALMIQLRRANLVAGQARLRVNGREMTVHEAQELADQVETVEVLDGVAAVEVLRLHEEDWNALESTFPVQVDFLRGSRKRRIERFAMGDRVDLAVRLPDGYRSGDLLHVSLPAAMSWIHGGGQVRQFTLDFEGENEVRVPLVVCSAIEGEQHFAVCVRNMFEEERIASPGILTVRGR